MTFDIPSLQSDFYLAASPIILLCVGAIIAMLQGVFKATSGPKSVYGVLIVTQLLALICAFVGTPQAETSFLDGALLAGDLGLFGMVFILLVGLTVTILFKETWMAPSFLRGEVASLFMMIVAVSMVMVTSQDLVTLFVGLELASIGVYALVGYVHPSRRSQEGAIKYFVLGSFAAALLLFGFALLYAGTGSMQINEIIDALPRMADHNWIRLGALFTMAGLGFKLALAPFHLWAPDAYEAAPTGITAFMATSIKIMVLILAMRIFVGGFNQLYDVWMPGLMFLAVISMILGNIMALVQTSLKRMLAYSSIAHSGYMAIAICALGGAAGDLPVAAILFYITGYAIMSLGAFGILMWLENERNDNLLLDDLNGLAKAHPWASFAMATFMFAFAGLPPTVGFIAKFFVFNAALKNQLYSLVIIGVIGSSISLFYYLRVIVRMYMTEPMDSASVTIAPTRNYVIAAVLAVSLVLTILLGTILPGPAMRLATRTAGELSTGH